jgi:hypothetical protein
MKVYGLIIIFQQLSFIVIVKGEKQWHGHFLASARNAAAL